MDFDPGPAQMALLEAVESVVEQTGGIQRAVEVSALAEYDAELDAALEDADLLREASMLDRVLVAERLAELGTATTFGIRAVVAMDADLPPGGLAVVDVSRRGPVRYAGTAATLVILRPDAVEIGVRGDDITDVKSGFGYPYANVDRSMLSGKPATEDPAVWTQRLRLAISAEIAGNAARAVEGTAAHLRSRTQFGRPLSTFQALRHRMSEAMVSAEATRWLVRYAAYTNSGADIDLAASYASQTAAALVPELVQMAGARSFAIEFGLHVFTMRLGGLRLELGGSDRLAAALLAH